MRAVASVSLLLVACGTPPWARGADDPLDAPPPEPEPRVVRVTRSPWKSTTADELPCGEADAALEQVAHRIAERRARGAGAPDPDTVSSWLRASGEPHVRPRVVTATGKAPIADETVQGRLEALRTPHARCGVARAPLPHGGEEVVAVVVDALADLAPLPMRARTGQWLTFEATLRAAAQSATLVVLGPRGVPRTVPTSLDHASGTVRARFAVERPGAYTVQLVGDLARGGPRPLLEARVFADVEPPPDDDGPAPVPGEDASADLAILIDALRSAESLPPLTHDTRLDAVATAHAERMRAAGSVAHDLGEGDLRARFAEASLDAHVVGENVARGPTVLHAHRALYASPSHRLNLLRADYTHVGVGLARADDGTVYACEVFAGGLR